MKQIRTSIVLLLLLIRVTLKLLPLDIYSCWCFSLSSLRFQPFLFCHVTKIGFKFYSFETLCYKNKKNLDTDKVNCSCVCYVIRSDVFSISLLSKSYLWLQISLKIDPFKTTMTFQRCGSRGINVLMSILSGWKERTKLKNHLKYRQNRKLISDNRYLELSKGFENPKGLAKL